MNRTRYGVVNSLDRSQERIDARREAECVFLESAAAPRILAYRDPVDQCRSSDGPVRIVPFVPG